MGNENAGMQSRTAARELREQMVKYREAELKAAPEGGIGKIRVDLSPSQTETNEKYVRASFILHRGSGQRVPDVLITWNHSDCWGNREIVKDLDPILVLRSRCTSREPRDVVLQRPTDSVVIDS